MFRIFRTTGNAHRPPPPFLFLIIINAFILKGSWTILALTCNWNTWARLQSTSCFWMRHVGLLHLERWRWLMASGWKFQISPCLWGKWCSVGFSLSLSLTHFLSHSHSHTSQLYHGLTVSVCVVFPLWDDLLWVYPHAACWRALIKLHPSKKKKNPPKHWIRKQGTMQPGKVSFYFNFFFFCLLCSSQYRAVLRYFIEQPFLVWPKWFCPTRISSPFKSLGNNSEWFSCRWGRINDFDDPWTFFSIAALRGWDLSFKRTFAL